MRVVAIGDDGTRSDPYEVHPRSPVAHAFGFGAAKIGHRAIVTGILYERVPDKAPADADQA